MIRLSMRNLRAHATRLVSTVSAVALGVAFLAGVLVLTGTFQRSFDDMFAAGGAKTDAVVRSTDGVDLGFGDSVRARLDASVIDAVAATPGVASVAPQREGLAQIEAADGNLIGGGGPPQVGGQWVTDKALNPWRISNGRPPSAPDEVVIDAASAREGKLAVGDATRVFTPSPVDVTVVGIATYGSAESIGPLTSALFSESGAIAHLGVSADEVTSLTVRADAGVGQGQLVAALKQTLPTGAEAITGAKAVKELQQIGDDFLGVIRPVLLAFVGLALAVGAFSIYNTFAIVVAQRIRDAALLRALGASRRQLLGSTLIEAALVGAVGASIGLALGVGLATLATRALPGLLASPGFGLAVSPTALIVPLAVGIGVTTLAALIPARRAAGVAPIEALRSSATDDVRVVGPRLIVGVVTLVLGSALGIAAVTTLGAGWAGGAAGLLLVGSLVLAPSLAGPLVGALGAPLARIRGVTGSLARRNAVRNPSRTGNTAAALIIGVAVVALFAVIGASFKASLNDIIDRSFSGDVVVESSAVEAGVGIAGSLRRNIDAVDGLATSAGLGDLAAEVDGNLGFLNFADARQLNEVLDLTVTSGDLAGMGEGDLAISSGYATKEGLAVGDTVPARFPAGHSTNLTVSAVYEDSALAGSSFVDMSTAQAQDSTTAPSILLLKAQPGVNPARLDARVQKAAADWPGVSVQTRDEFAASRGRQIDQVLALVYGLLALSVIIALFGIANALALSVLERRRELGLLRALGQDRRQTRAMIRWEAVLVASVGTLVGLVVGVVSAWMLLASASGVFSRVAVPVFTLGAVVAIGAVSGVLASARPARRAARADVLSALAAP